jgi:hypothetical protein
MHVLEFRNLHWRKMAKMSHAIPGRGIVIQEQSYNPKFESDFMSIMFQFGRFFSPLKFEPSS